MGRKTRNLAWTVLVLAVVAAPRAFGAPVNSDLATAQLGGGCYPTGIQPGLLDMLVLVNPEWAPLQNGQVVDSSPIVIHGVVQGMHGDTSGDFPSTHVRADVNHFVLLDAVDADRLATGNDDGLIHTEWEAGAYPAWAWAGTGDRVVAMGRWIFDCGHPGPTPGNCSATTSQQCVIDSDCPNGETCTNAHFAYSAEMHPPQATAAIRQGRGGILLKRAGAPAVPATRADVFVSPDGGGAGDRCILTHRANATDLLSVQCFPLAQAVATQGLPAPLNAQDFHFDVPLPPRPHGGTPKARLVTYPAPGGVAARIRKRPRIIDPSPHMEVTVRMSRRVHGQMPTGFAGTIFAGWLRDTSPLTHVRLTIDTLEVNNALQLATPVAPKTCAPEHNPPLACDTTADCRPPVCPSCANNENCLGVGPVKAWQMQAAVNGEWQEFGGLASVDTGEVIPQALVFDQYLPPSGAVHLELTGVARECVDALYNRSLATNIAEVGFVKGLACLASNAHSAGTIDVSYGGPDFGAGTGTMTYATTSTGGEGGHCSMTTGMLCVVNGDCPSGETCVITGGAITLHYTIARL